MLLKQNSPEHFNGVFCKTFGRIELVNFFEIQSFVESLHVHLYPPKVCYENVPISSADCPAIKMDPADHKFTASNGSSKAAIEYRAKQKKLLDEGKLEETIQMDIDDIRSKFGTKYDSAIKEMVDYARTLDPEVFKGKLLKLT